MSIWGMRKELFMIRLLAAAKNFNQLLLENAPIKKCVKSVQLKTIIWTTSPINSFKNERLDFLQIKEK